MEQMKNKTMMNLIGEQTVIEEDIIKLLLIDEEYKIT